MSALHDCRLSVAVVETQQPRPAQCSNIQHMLHRVRIGMMAAQAGEAHHCMNRLLRAIEVAL